MREASLKDKGSKFPHLYFILTAFFWGLDSIKTHTMIFSSQEKKAIVLAMKLMIDADHVRHPNEKLIYDCIYKSLNISYDESIAIMAFMSSFIDDAINEHFSIIANMDIEKKKDVISILTTLAAIDKHIDNSENELLTQYRLVCELPYTKYSLLEAMQNAQKYIVK